MDYKYKGFTFRATNTMTEYYQEDRHGYLHSKLAALYEIDGLKEKGKRPFLTSVRDCKEYINNIKNF